MVALHVEESGSGEPLLLIHGWGMHGGMWADVVARLARDFRVLSVDLPGHGHSGMRNAEGGSLDEIVDELSERFGEPLNLCGWSLGGQVALRWAQRHPQQVRRLVLVTSTPCFVRRPGWECAMAEQTLAEFAAALEQNYALTLRRFLALQVRGSKDERELLAELRNALFSRGEPELAALQSGLDILRDCDLREVLPQIVQPALVIAGERDTLTPPDASRHLAERMPQARLALVEGAAHAPFLSHLDRFVACIKDFLEERT
ncbi:MAG TPA: pimeloyl-ACP methyl ester esterase BioH [Gallionella sp.]|nr:pimeloyl-ACP methyl ester esterase BioH [Gallionella sp.]